MLALEGYQLPCERAQCAAPAVKRHEGEILCADCVARREREKARWMETMAVFGASFWTSRDRL